MKQTRAVSLIEALISTGAGFGLSVTAQAIFLPLLGLPISLSQNLVFALIMTAISIARQFVLRRVFEALHIRRPLSAAALAVVAERRRQVDVEGWSNAHDDARAIGDLASAGAAYAAYARWHLLDEQRRKSSGIFAVALKLWPWSPEWWKPRDFRRDLVRAAALIIAEIDKFDRAKTNRRRPY